MIDFNKCFTGRRWINIGSGLFAVGFGPNKFIDRLVVNGSYYMVDGRWLNKDDRKALKDG